MTRAYTQGALFLVAAELAAGLFLLLPNISHAATLYLSPTSRTLAVGERATLTVYVDAAGVPINAVSGSITYDASALEAVSIGKSGSVVNFWVQEPSISAGGASFEGVILNPGYSGSRGKVADITFIARREADLSVSIAGASVLANDGTGTNVITGTSGTSFSVQQSQQTEEEESVPEQKVATKAADVVITSSTHPEEDVWYSAASASFQFGLPAGADALRLILSRTRSAKPSVVYAPALSEKRIDDLPEGVTYLVAEARTNGIWGAATSRKIQVDRTAPTAFTAALSSRADATNPAVVISASAKDAVSGIAGFAVLTSGGEVKRFEVGTPITIGPLPPQHYQFTVTAYDRAGNQTESISLSAEVAALAAPTIDDISPEVAWGSTFSVRGTAAHAGGTARMTLSRGEDSYTITAAVLQDGSFQIERQHDLPSGTYSVSIVTIDTRGAQSAPAQAGSTEFLSQPIGEMLIAFGKDLGAGFFVLLALLGFMGLLSGLYLKFARWHGKLRNEVREANMTVEKSFNLLREDIEAFMAELAKESGRRKLTPTERRFIKTMKDNFAEANAIIKKEIRDVADSVE